MPPIFILIIALFITYPSITPALELDRVLTITATARVGGKILPNGETNVLAGRNQAFLITPDDGYDIAYLIIDGKTSKPAATYIFKEVSENHTIVVVFQAKKRFTIKVVNGDNGRIFPSETIDLYEYESQTFKIVPDEGYSIGKMIIDGLETKPESEYTFWDVIENHLISVSFAPLRKFVIVAESADGGDIFPSGKITVEEHSDQMFRIVPKTGFIVQIVQVDLTNNIGPIYQYMFRDIKEDHTIHVNFMEERIIRGRVIDFDTRKGINGCKLEAWGYLKHDFSLGTTQSDATGQYTLSHIPPVSDLVIRCHPPSDMPLLKQVDDPNVTGQDDGSNLPPIDDGSNFPPDDGSNLPADDGTNPVYDTKVIDGDIEIKNEILDIRQSKYPSQYYQNKTSFEEADQLNVLDRNLDKINFELKSYNNIGFRGRVHDGTTGVKNVLIIAASAKHLFTKFALTDDNGDYTINYLVPSDDYIVKAEFPDLHMHMYFALSKGQTVGVDSPSASALLPNFATMISPSNPYLKHIDLLFDPGAEISGHVYDSRGQPLSNIRVNAWSPIKQRGNASVTDKTGAYTIKGLTEVLPLVSKISGYIVDVHANNYPYQVYDTVSDQRQATLVATGRTDIDFVLRDGFSISGQVRPTSGAALKNVPVVTNSPSVNVQRKTLTDESGFYTFAGLTPADDYQMAAFAPNYPVQFYQQQSNPLMATSVNILSADAENINFILDKGAIIKGLVQFESLVGRLPPMMAHIWSFSAQSGGDVRVENDGTFVMVGLNETITDYMVMVNANDYPTAYYCDNGDDNPENDTVYERMLAKGVSPSDKEHLLILKPGYTLSGTISCEKIMMPMIRVKAWSEQSGVFKHTKASMMEGHYQYSFKGLASGTYEIVVDEKNVTSEKQVITVIDQDINDIDFTLKEIQGNEVSGMIYNLPTGETVSIHAWSLSMDAGKTIRIKGMGKAAQYRIKGLAPASDYRMELLSDRYPTQIYNQKTDFKSATLINISNGDVRGIDFTIDQTSDNAFILGSITFPQNAEMGETVRIHAHSMTKRMSTSTDIMLGAVNPAPYTLLGLVSSDDIVLSIWPEHYPHQFYNHQENGDLATHINTSDDTPDVINFILDTGRTLSGMTVDAEGLTVVNVRVSVFSESTGSRGYAFSDTEGTFQISGLKPADDFILKAYSSTMGTFYYVSDSSSDRNQSNAVSLDLSSDSIENITLNLSEGYAISGTVQNVNGLLLENIRVDAWSDSLESGNSAFTDENGEFTISGLPSSMDYQVTARPDKRLSYQSQTKTYIETGTSDIQFLLSSLETFTLMGTVMDSSLSPVSCVTIKVCARSDLNDCAWDQTDENGQYEISGLVENTYYQLDVIPDTDCSMGFLRIYPLAIMSDTTRDITLSAGATISGTVLASSSSLPISNASIQVLSESTGFFEKTSTGIDGTYEVTHAPDVTDFEITASADGYIDATLSNQAGTSDLDLSLDTGGTLSGQVTDASSGEYIEGAVVEIYSSANQNTANYGGIAVTDALGNYSVEQLKVTDASGDTLADYVVTAHAPGYPEQVISGAMAGDTVNVYLYATSDEAVSVTVTDSSGLIGETSSIIVSIFNEDGYYARKSVDTLTGFSLTGLSSDETYQLLFTAYTDGEEILSQWASADGTGVVTQDQAGTFVSGAILKFVFTPNLRRSIKKVYGTGPGAVRDLRSTTHDYRLITKRLRSNSSSDTSTVSNNPNITVTWDAPDDGEDDLSGYYTDFNTNDDYSHSAFNTVEKPVTRTRKITSSDLDGDDVSYYFHVAAVDVEGRIGQTTSIAFRIDTVPPTNVSVTAPIAATDRNIALVLGATGASDVFISNVNYEESGDWDNLATEKEWKLTRGDGIKTIYVRFRDAAGNRSDTMTVTTFVELMENSSPMISDRTFTLSESLTDGLYVGIVEASDADDDPLTFTLDNGSTVYGFGLGSDSGLLFVDQADLFPGTPGAYDLTVTVQDSEEVASANVRVNVTSGNYPPEMVNQGFSIDEHSPINTPVGMVDAIDSDGDTLSFFIISGNDPEIFAIAGNTGILSVLSNTLLDYETQASIVLTVGVSDSQLTSTAQITITINNINDHAPIIQAQTFSIDENPDSMALIGQLIVSDADGQTPVCTIESGNTGNAMKLDSQTCQLTVNDPSLFDYEQEQKHYILTVSVSDGTLSSSSEITVTVHNINDLAPEMSPQTCTVSENSPIDTQVYTLTASDPDQLSRLVFQFIHPDEALPFFLDQDTGIIQVSSAIDYETQSAYTLTVQVWDYHYTATARLIIHVLNENDNAPVIHDHQFYILETIANQSIIGPLTASDADGDSLEYSLLTHAASFVILPDLRLQVIDNQLIDAHEQGGVLTLSLLVSDGLFSDQAVISLSITPVNDHAPVMVDRQCTVSESADSGQELVLLAATDLDGETLIYSIIAGNDAGQFNIAEHSGQITIAPAAQLDYETQSQYTLTVQADDGFYTTTASVVVMISNANDNPPVTQDHACTIQENSPQETPVCTVFARDTDGDSLLFSLISDTPAFKIDPNTGMIRIQDAQLIDYEMIEAYTLYTAITDGIYTVTQQTIVSLTNENDNPPEISVSSIQTLEDTATTTCIQWSDPDMDALTLLIQTLALHGETKLTGDTCLTYTPNTNYEGMDSLALAAFDGIHTSDAQILSIVIIPVNDPPVLAVIDDIAMLEDTASEIITIPVTDSDSSLSEIELSVYSGQQALIPNDTAHIHSEKTETGFTLQLIPETDQSGTAQLSVTVFDGIAKTTTTFICTVYAQNDPPVISMIGSVIIDEDTISPPIAISLSDNETPSEALILTASSTNPLLIPEDNIYLSITGAGSTCQLIITPLADMSGTAIIHVSVNDGSQSTTSSLSVTVNPVNDPPEIFLISDQTTDEDTTIGPLILNLSDKETSLEALILTVETSHPSLLPPSSITTRFNALHNQYELSIHPAENQWGSSQVNLTVSDGELSVSTQFTVTVEAVNDPPAISTIPDQTFAENTSTGPISFTVTDQESHIDGLLLILESSNTLLIPIDNTHASISGQTLTLTPVSFESGSSRITLTVDDGSLQSRASFILTIISVDQAPEISNIIDQNFEEDTAMSPLSFTVWDPETAVEFLNVWAETSNSILFPDTPEHIQIEFQNSAHWIKLVPAHNQYGLATVTIYADDGVNITHEVFGVTVHPVEDMPVLVPPMDIQVQEDASSQTLSFQASDPETPATELVITAISDNTALIPSESIGISGTTNDRWLKVSIAPGHFGLAHIYMTLSDAAGNTQTHMQTITVLRGNTLAFNGENDYVEIPDHETLQVENTLTVEAWVMPCTPTLIERRIINKIDDHGHGFSLALISGNFIQVMAGNETHSFTLTSKTAISENIWTHIAASITQQGICLYIDGQQDAESVQPVLFNLNQGQALILGGQSDTPTVSSFCGQMDDIRLWRIERTEKDIADNMNQRLQGNENGLMGYWYFKDSEANDHCTLNDALNHGIIHKDAPMISMILDLQTHEDTPVDVIEFSVSDIQTPSENLVVTVQSSDSNLVPDSHLVLSGSGKTRYLKITPASNHFGTCTITLSVDDHETVTTQSFQLRVLPVNDSPQIAIPSTLTVLEDSAAQAVAFQLTDIDNDLNELSVTVKTGDSQLLPLKNITLNQDAQWLSFTPTAQQFGTVQLTVTVSDGQLSDSAVLTVTVLPVNDPPVMSAIADQEMLEDAAEINISFTLQDIETPLEALSVSMVLSPPDASPFLSVFISGEGTERFIHATPANNASGTLMVTITVTDDHSEPASVSHSFTLTILPVNDPPEMSLIDDLVIDEDTPSVEIMMDIMDMESLSSELYLTAVSLNETLIPQKNVHVIENNSTYKLYFFPAVNMYGSGDIQLSLADPDGKSVTQRFTVTVNAVNDVPVIQTIKAITIHEDSASAPLAITVSDSETLPENLIVNIYSSNPQLINDTGLALSQNNGRRELILTPLPNQSGMSLIEIEVADAEGLTQRSLMTLTVLPVNDTPIISEIADIIFDEDTLYGPIELSLSDIETPVSEINMAWNISDPSVLSIDDIQVSLESSACSVMIAPKSNINGQTTVCLMITDSGNLTATSCFDVTILPVNDLPELSNISSISVIEDSTVPPITVYVSDSETPLDQLNIQWNSSEPSVISHENISIHGDSDQRLIQLSLKENTWGSTWISLTLTDQEGGQVSTKFFVDIAPVNDPPIFEAIDDITAYEDHPIDPVVLNIQDNETPQENLQVMIMRISGCSYIRIRYNDDRNVYEVHFDIQDNAFCDTYIEIQVSDPEGLTAVRDFQLHQLPVNDAPEIDPISDQTIVEDAPAFSIPLTIRDMETSADYLNLTITLENKHLLTYDGFSVEKESTYYSPFNIFSIQFNTISNTFGLETVRVEVSDADGLTAVQTFTIQILPENDPPTIQPISNKVSNEDEILGPFPVFINDVDNSKDLLTIQIIADKALIAYSQISHSELTLIPSIDLYGSTDVSVVISDPHGLTAVSSFIWTVLPQLDPPILSDISDSVIDEDSTDQKIYFSMSHVDYAIDELSLSLTSNLPDIIDPEKQVLDTSFVLISPEADQWGTVQLCLLVSDPNLLSAQSCFSVTIVSQNDPPVISVSQAYTMDEDSSLLIPFTVQDVDSEIAVSMIHGSSNTSFEISEPVLIEDHFAIGITPTADFSGTAILTIYVNDTNDGTDYQTIKLTVLPVNDSPVAHSGQFQVYEDLSVIGQLNGSDIDGDDLTFTIAQSPQYGSIQLLDDHKIQYKPTADIYGMDHFSFYVSDALASSDPAWITIIIQGIPDSPTANAGNDLTVNELQTVVLDASQTIDPDNDIASYRWQQTSGVSVSLTNTDSISISFVPPDTAKDQDLIFELLVTDLTGRSSKDSVVVHVIDISAPTVGFHGSPVEGIVPHDVQFTDTSIGKISSWLWEFGDGYISREENPLHIYSKSGEYTVILTVTGPYGTRSKEKTDYINVSAAELKANFIASPTQGVAPLTVEFKDHSQGEIDHMTWNFGDGTQSSSFSPIHTYEMPGEYTVTLSVSDAESMDIKVKPMFISVSDRKIYGTIATEDDHDMGINGCWVIAYGNNFTCQTISDAHGNYTISGLPAADSIKLGGWPADDQFLSQIYNQKENLADADMLSTKNGDLTEINLYLKPMPSLQIKGRVHDGNQGKVNLLVSAFSDASQWGAEAITTSDGSYTLTGLKPANDYLVSVWWVEHSTLVYYALPEGGIVGQDIPTSSQFDERLATSVTLKDQNLSQMDMILSLQNTGISGQITDSNGLGLGNIWVNAWSIGLETGNGALSDENGHYTIMGLRSVAEADALEKGYDVTIQTNGFFAYPNRLAVPSMDINFQLSRTAWISGKITDETGIAVNQACIHVWSESDATRTVYTSCADSNGNYTVTDLPFLSDYRVSVISSDYPDHYFENTRDLKNARYVDITDGPLPSVNVVLSFGGNIGGQVYIDSMDQTAPSGLWVNVWSPSAGISRQVQTNDAGAFHINGLDESIHDYYVMIQDSDYLPAFYSESSDNHTSTQKEQGTTVDANGHAITLVLQAGLSVCGTMTGSFDHSKALRLTARSENFGIYQTLDISAGSTTFCLEHLTADYYYFTLYQGNQVLLTQSMLVISTMNQLELSVNDSSLAQISGKIQGLSENVWAQVRVWSDNLKTEKTVRILGTGSDISYCISGLSRSDDYAAVLSSDVFPDDYFDQSHFLSHATRIDISKNNATSIDFMLQENTASLSGTLYFSGNESYTGKVKLTLWSPSLGITRQKTVSISGQFETAYSITQLKKASDYILGVKADGFGRHYYTNDPKTGLPQKLNLETTEILSGIDFHLTRGVSIAGHIETDVPIHALTVEAESQISEEVLSVAVSADGAYRIQGMPSDHSFLMWVRHTNGNRWYYAGNQTVMNKNAAEWIIPNSEHSFDFNIQQLKAIAGTVKSVSGQPVANVWVQASDITGNISAGNYTGDDGTYEIPFLPDQTYGVRVYPNSNTLYIKSEKTDIKAGNVSVHFILEEKTGATLSGTVRNLKTRAEPLARIDIVDDQSTVIQTVSDHNGSYCINGLSLGTSYNLSVFPSSDSDAAFLRTMIEITENDQTLDIELPAGIHMTGTVIDKNSNQAIPQARVIWQSDSTGYYTGIQTDELGFFECFAMPDSSDYKVQVISSNYQGIYLSNQQPEEYRGFQMVSSGSVTGFVVNQETGKGIADAVVHIQSSRRDIERSSQTDKNGAFILSGLIEKDEQGKAVTDYVLTVFANQYPVQILRSIQSGQHRTIALSQQSSQRIHVRIQSDTSWVLDIFESDAHFVQSMIVQSNEWMTCSGLNSDTRWQLRISDESLSQSWWIGDTGQLTDSRDQAGKFLVSAQIDIQVSQGVKRTAKNTSQSVAATQNFLLMDSLKENTLPSAVIISNTHPIFTPETPNVSAIPIIEINWDISPSDNITGYYVVFNEQPDFEWNKTTASGYHVIPLNSLSSPDFSGNETTLYGHVAAVNTMGTIGPTAHAGPYIIDTLAPDNIRIIAPSSTSSRSLLVQLFAQDTQEIYISTLGYEIGSAWQPYAQNLTILLPSQAGQHILYASFRDRAKNTSRTSTSLTLESPENTIPVANKQAFITLEDKILTSTLSGQDNDGDSIQYEIQTFPAYGVLNLLDTKTGAFQYIPVKDFFGHDYFTFIVNDGAADSSPALCTMTVQNQNDAPVLQSFEFLTQENTRYSGYLQATDIDQDTLTYKIHAQPAKGSVQLIDPQTGAFQYIPHTNITGKDSFLFTASDSAFQPQPVLVKVEIIAAQSPQNWYSGWYPEGYIVDKQGLPLDNILITYYGDLDTSYTRLTDDNGYFVFETQKVPKTKYALNASGENYADIWMTWPQDNPPQTFELLSVLDSETVLLTGTCSGIDGDIDALIMADGITVKSVFGEYTLAVKQGVLPVDLTVLAEGYHQAVFQGISSGVDVLLEREGVTVGGGDKDDGGCFIGVVGF
ncbi:MAG: tandem-95 repeat protein [Candidatus Magnetomorum sp.]|nr:tandem-95 repeat protein [Candidatus Magnetomorum sp.]